MPKVNGPYGTITVQEAAQKLRTDGFTKSFDVSPRLRKACLDGDLQYTAVFIGVARVARFVRYEDAKRFWLQAQAKIKNS